MATYKELVVYRKSYELVLEMYTLTDEMPKDEQYGLKNQMRRAAVSIPVNIAEGYGKMSGAAETKRFLSISRGSCCELEVLLSLGKDLGYLPKAEVKKLMLINEEVGKMLTGLMKTLTKN